MQTYEQRQSGLVVPKEKPKPPERKYGPLEIQEAEQRAIADKALRLLWDAMELRSPPRFCVPGCESYDAHLQAWDYIGKMILGKDCPEHEVYT
jgi:hypothetical protein